MTFACFWYEALHALQTAKQCSGTYTTWFQLLIGSRPFNEISQNIRRQTPRDNTTPKRLDPHHDTNR